MKKEVSHAQEERECNHPVSTKDTTTYCDECGSLKPVEQPQQESWEGKVNEMFEATRPISAQSIKSFIRTLLKERELDHAIKEANKAIKKDEYSTIDEIMKKKDEEDWEHEFRETFGEFVIEKESKIVASEESVKQFIRSLLEKEKKIAHDEGHEWGLCAGSEIGLRVLKKKATQAERERVIKILEGMAQTPGSSPDWESGYRDGYNLAIYTAINLIRKEGENE